MDESEKLSRMKNMRSQIRLYDVFH